MKQTIHSHTYPNGLVLVAEPMQSVESAAFTLRVPAGCIYEPADRGGLSGMTCEMVLRGTGPRDNRQFINDLDNLGVDRDESVSDAHTGFVGATLAKNLHAVLAKQHLTVGRTLQRHPLRSTSDSGSCPEFEVHPAPSRSRRRARLRKIRQRQSPPLRIAEKSPRSRPRRRNSPSWPFPTPLRSGLMSEPTSSVWTCRFRP